jgi:hypothetical protein
MNHAELEELREYTTAMKNMFKLRDPGGVMWLLNSMPRYLVPNVKHMIEENKDVIVKYILEKINRYGFLDNLVIGSLNGLDTARINWPELAIIKKSVQAEEAKQLSSDM